MPAEIFSRHFSINSFLVNFQFTVSMLVLKQMGFQFLEHCVRQFIRQCHPKKVPLVQDFQLTQYFTITI